MASHAEHSDAAAVEDKVVLGEKARSIFKYAQYTAGVAFVLSLLFALILPGVDSTSSLRGTGGLKRFYFSYLAAYAFVLSISLASLVFLLIQHVCRAGWSVVVRRQMENLACILPTLGFMSLPILVSVVFQRGDLYRWALPLSAAEHVHHGGTGVEAGPDKAGHGATTAPIVGEKASSPPEERHGATPSEPNMTPEAATAGHHDDSKPVLTELTLKKRAWLNPWFFTLRIVLYFVIWSAIARWYRRQSILQDQTGDVRYTHAMEKWSPICLIVSGLTVTLAAFDLVMSLDPHWYSTIFGVYYFAGGAIAFWAALIVIVQLLQRAGYLQHAINKEHYHDLGKFLFGFVFFWGYIAFSQYMLLWYANIPEETEYLSRHGFTTSAANISGWSYVGLVLLFFKLAIPFLGLLSRHVKRNKKTLIFWAIWLLVFHYVDCYWMVLPEMRVGFKPSPIDLTALILVISAALVAFIGVSLRGKLMPTADPRLPEALAFHNI